MALAVSSELRALAILCGLLVLVCSLGSVLPLPRDTTNSPYESDEVTTADSLAAATGGGREQRRSFAGYTVLRLHPESRTQLEYLHSLAQNDSQLDFWTRPSTPNTTVDVMVPPRMLNKFESSLDRLNINKEYLIDDVESAVSKERDALDEPQLLYRSPNAFAITQSFFDNYHRFQEINEFMESIASEYPAIASTFNIGKSFEGRDLRVLRIGSAGAGGGSSRSKSKPAIYLDSGIHAREWVAVSTVLFVAHRLVKEYETDPVVTRLVDHFDWFLLPVANPDGYEYTHTNDRMWRKTRSSTNSRWGCRGVDPNRNFDFHWNEVGTSDSPCSEIYAGSRAFSEIEARAIAEFIMRKKDSLKLYLAIHSYSQLWLTPWGFTTTLPENYPDLERKANAAVNAIKSRYGTDYRVGSSTNVLYAAAGGADDWAYGVVGVPYVYTVELRDKGKHGFLLPRNQIIPVGEETWDGVKAIAEEIRNSYFRS